MKFATVFKSLVGKYRGGSKDSLIVTSKALGNDYQSKNAFAPGLEINPAAGERIIIEKIGGSDSYNVSIGGISENVAPDTDPGERRIFSVNNAGELSTYLKLTNTGLIELAGNGNFAVLFNEMLTEFNKLNAKYDDLVQKYNLHTHPYVDTPVGASVTSVTTSTGSASDADMSNAKSEKVLLSDNDD